MTTKKENVPEYVIYQRSFKRKEYHNIHVPEKIENQKERYSEARYKEKLYLYINALKLQDCLLSQNFKVIKQN